MKQFFPAELIKKKRQGLPHERAELEFMVQHFVVGTIPDYQMSAWLMAVFFRGMTPEETAWLTEIMMNSGRVLPFRDQGRWAVDKHSTGGVGDKTSLILTPLVAACGGLVPMMAGRGLGHTGGTLDKLEAIPGMNVHLEIDRFVQTVETLGGAISGQTKEVCPADMKLYALRDVTATVESIPLICASIMSKKLAEGLSSLVLDVKFGSGAFMKTASDAHKLAEALIQIGEHHGVRVTAVLTNMDQPLGRFIGNSVEVFECLEIMKGQSFFENDIDFYSDTRELTIELAIEMLLAAQLAPHREAARAKAAETLKSGAALNKFLAICAAQGAVPDWKLPVSPSEHIVRYDGPAGYVTLLDSEGIGYAAIQLGAGRLQSTDKIDHSAGIELFVKVGLPIEPGQKVFRLFSQNPQTLALAERRLKTCLQVGPQPPAPAPLIYGYVTAKGVEYAN
jgi:pyrimidine-nucleoside phosphorylase